MEPEIQIISLARRQSSCNFISSSHRRKFIALPITEPSQIYKLSIIDFSKYWRRTYIQNKWKKAVISQIVYASQDSLTDREQTLLSPAYLTR